MITKILQYYRGFVIVRIISHSPERFLNLCRNHEIVLQDALDKAADAIYYVISYLLDKGGSWT